MQRLQRPLAFAVPLVALLLAGCRQAPAATPGTPGTPGPGMPTGAVSVAALLQALPASQRVEMADLERGCQGATGCQDDLKRFKAAMKERCPGADGCTDPVGRLLYVTRTADERRSGAYPGTLPRVEDVLKSYAALGGSGAGSP